MAQITYFDAPGKQNTEACLDLARQRADELGIDTIVVASTRGEAALAAAAVFGGKTLVVVTHAVGWREPNVPEFPEETRRKLVDSGVAVLTTNHVLAGLGRAIKRKRSRSAEEELVADSLRIFGQGAKVCCEITVMACDAGLARTDRELIAIAGTDHGCDTAFVMKPVNTQDLFDLRVQEIICKPRF